MNDGYPTKSPRTRGSALAQLTGAATLAIGALLYGNGSSQLQTLAPGAAGTVLVSQGAAAPAWVNIYSQANVWTVAQTIDKGTGNLPAPTNATRIALTFAHADGQGPNIEGFSFGGGSAMTLRPRYADGTRAAPAAAAGNSPIFALSCTVFDGTTWVNNTANLTIYTDGLQSISNRGAYYVFQGVPNGSTTSAEWMRLQNAAACFGTTNQGGRLNVGISSTDTSLYYNNQAFSIYQSNGTANNMASFDFRTANGNSAAAIAAQYTAHTAGAAAADLLFYTAYLASAASERMRITSTGNVGIGLYPSSKLHVLVGANDGLRLTDGTMTGVVYMSSGPTMTVGTISNHPVTWFSNNIGRGSLNADGTWRFGTDPGGSELVRIGGSLKAANIECTGVSRAQNYFGVITFTTPASATAAGTAGHMTWDTNYIYVCTGTNTWKRVAIATW